MLGVHMCAQSKKDERNEILQSHHQIDWQALKKRKKKKKRKNKKEENQTKKDRKEGGERKEQLIKKGRGITPIIKENINLYSKQHYSQIYL